MPDLKKVDLGNLAADGSTPWHQVTGSERNPAGGVHVRSTGDFDGGTLTWEGSQDGVTPYALGENAEFTAAGGVGFKLKRGNKIRATLSGATTPSLKIRITQPLPTLIVGQHYMYGSVLLAADYFKNISVNRDEWFDYG